MTISWGYKITILYLGFVGIILTLVIISANNKEELVSKDYYDQEIKYQNKIDAINNEKALAETILMNVDEENITLTAPQKWLGNNLSGELFLFCPSDSKKDTHLKFNFTQNGVMNISKKQFAPAAYKVNISWSKDGTNYFKESVISIK